MNAPKSSGKNAAIVALIVVNTLLLGVIIGRYMKPNAAVAQNTRPGDYTLIPCDFPGAQTGSVVIIDNTTGEMSALLTDEQQHRMMALPRINVSTLFDRAANRTPARR